MPAAVMDSIIVDHTSESNLENTRPQYSSETWRSSCGHVQTELTATAARDSAIRTSGSQDCCAWLNRTYAPPWMMYAKTIVRS